MNIGIKKVKKVFKKLQQKICVDCGCNIEEYQESLFTKCDHCLSKEIE